MNIAELIASVMTVTEFLKFGLKKLFRIDLKGVSAFILAFIMSGLVVSFSAFVAQVPFDLALAIVFLKVVFGATVGYAVITKKSSKKEANVNARY